MEENRENPPVQKNRTRRGTLVLLLLFIGITIWAAFVPLAKGIVATGKVVVDSQRKTIQHLEGGVITTINVRDGSQVKTDEILMTLDDTKARTERDMVRSRYLMKLAILDRLIAQQQWNTVLEFREELLLAQENQQVKELLASQNNLFKVLRDEQKGQRSILKKRIDLLKEKMTGLGKYQKTVQKQIKILEPEIARLQQLLEKHLIESSILIERMQVLTQQFGEWEKTQTSFTETGISIGEAELNLSQAEAEWQQDLAKQVAETLEAIIELKSQLGAAENVLKRVQIHAPLAGVVIGLKVHTVGGVITPGTPIMDIVPIDDKLVVEAQIQPLDIDSIHSGMTAKIRFSSFNAKTTPELFAVVEQVSADAIVEPVKEMLYYLARLSIGEKELAKLSTQQAVIPGMPVEVYINGGNRTLIQYLFEPLSEIFRKGMREE